jgi:hypothetical protein
MSKEYIHQRNPGLLEDIVAVCFVFHCGSKRARIVWGGDIKSLSVFSDFTIAVTWLAQSCSAM